jgi:hypothetical protein
MTLALDRAARVSAEAREVQIGTTLLAVLAGVLYGVGWLAGWVVTLLGVVFSALGRGLVWVGVAVKLGFTDARAGRRRDGAA